MQISDEQLAALDALAKEATPGPWHAGGDWVEITGEDAFKDGVLIQLAGNSRACGSDMFYIAAANPAVIRAMIAELREYRHLCAQVRAVYDSDSGFGEGMVISCHRESQRKGTQAVAAMLIWQQPADESADLRIGIRADMT